MSMQENQASINEWIVATFGDVSSNASVVARANQEMSELLMALIINDHHPDAIEEAADIVIILFRLAERERKDLMEEVNRKMSINRKRRWKIGHGHGYHIEEQ
jgi:hypothetical protein